MFPFVSRKAKETIEQYSIDNRKTVFSWPKIVEPSFFSRILEDNLAVWIRIFSKFLNEIWFASNEIQIFSTIIRDLWLYLNPEANLENREILRISIKSNHFLFVYQIDWQLKKSKKYLLLCCSLSHYQKNLSFWNHTHSKQIALNEKN